MGMASTAALLLAAALSALSLAAALPNPPPRAATGVAGGAGAAELAEREVLAINSSLPPPTVAVFTGTIREALGGGVIDASSAGAFVAPATGTPPPRLRSSGCTAPQMCLMAGHCTLAEVDLLFECAPGWVCCVPSASSGSTSASSNAAPSAATPPPRPPPSQTQEPAQQWPLQMKPEVGLNVQSPQPAQSSHHPGQPQSSEHPGQPQSSQPPQSSEYPDQPQSSEYPNPPQSFQQLGRPQPPQSSQQLGQPQSSQRPSQPQSSRPPQSSEHLGQPQPIQSSQHLNQPHPTQSSQHLNQPQPTQSSQHLGQPRPPQSSQRPGQLQPPQSSQHLGQPLPTQISQHSGQPQPTQSFPQPTQSSQRPVRPQPTQSSQHLGHPQLTQTSSQSGHARPHPTTPPTRTTSSKPAVPTTRPSAHPTATTPAAAATSKPLLPGTDVCGKVNTENRITNGKIASPGQFPWMAILGYRSRTRRGDSRVSFLCGGTLINEKYVLTAAHCISSQNRPVLVRLGEFNLTEAVDCDHNKVCAPPPLDMEVESITTHPDFDLRNIKHDIALIRLSRSVPEYTEFVRPICLPVGVNVTDDKKFKIAGWGKTYFRDAAGSPVLQFTDVNGVGHAECNELQPPELQPLDPGQLCAGGDKGKDACKGDSGGPLMVTLVAESPAEFGPNYVTFQVGVVSYGPDSPCGTAPLPSIYTRVTAYMPWILSTLKP